MRTLIACTAIAATVLLTGCGGTVSHRPHQHYYQTPPRVSIGSGHKHYAVIKVENGTNTVDTDAVLKMPGLTPVADAQSADIVCRIELEPTIAANKDMWNRNYVPFKDPSPEQSEKPPIWTILFTARTPYRIEYIDQIEGRTVERHTDHFDQDGLYYPLLGHKTKEDAHKHFPADPQTGAGVEKHRVNAYNAAVAAATEHSNGLFTPGESSIVLYPAYSSQNEPRLLAIYDLVTSPKEEDLQAAIAQYEAIGTNQVLPDGMPAVDENYAVQYGIAACLFRLGKWQEAHDAALAAKAIKNSMPVNDLIGAAEWMAKRAN